MFTSGPSVSQPHESRKGFLLTAPQANKDSPRDDSWWPKPQAWSDSGLDFGVWTPFDEQWYSKRAATLNTPRAACLGTREWKSNIKFKQRPAAQFLTGARYLAQLFIEQQRL